MTAIMPTHASVAKQDGRNRRMDSTFKKRTGMQDEREMIRYWYVPLANGLAEHVTVCPCQGFFKKQG
jgi:hypothetical protein